MLVAAVRESSPPFTSMRPSASIVVPGQNMLGVVLVTVLATGAPGFMGSNNTVTVWSVAPLPPKRSAFHDAQAITLRLGSSAAEIGTAGKLYTWLQVPLAADCATGASASKVQRKLVDVAQVPCSRLLLLAPPGDCRHLPEVLFS